MAYYIKIKKIDENSSYALYKATNENHDFLIKIDILDQTIDFFKNAESSSCYSIDLKNTNQKIDIPWIDPHIIYAVFIKASRVIQLKQFPDDISFCV